MSIKNTLCCGDVVIARNGWQGTYMPNYASIESVFFNVKENGYLPFQKYDDNLDFVFGDERNKDWDIVKIYRAKHRGIRPWDEINDDDFSVVWERENRFQNLRSGDVIILRNGFQYVYMKNWGNNYCDVFLGCDGGWMDPADYDPYSLTYPDTAWDIVKIYRPEDHSTVPWKFDVCKEWFELIWETESI